jgi:hypothetical protein
MKYILIGSHGNEKADKRHLKDIAVGVYDYSVAKTFVEAIKTIVDLKRKNEEYFAVLNMNVLTIEDVNNSKLVKMLVKEKRAVLSYNHENSLLAG